MTRLSLSIKTAVLQHRSNGFSSSEIAQKLETEMGVKLSRQAICYFLLCYRRTSRLVRKPGSRRPTKITQPVLQATEAKMQADDETTATQLQCVLEQSGFNICLSTIRRARYMLGWTFHGTRYCQLIRTANKEKRLP